MEQLSKYKVILWDFDGVIMDSMPIRDLGFEKTLSDYPNNQVEELLDFHRKNGGLSRYVKFRYFFENIRKETVIERQIADLAQRFSEIMLSLLINEKLLINDSIKFIKNNSENFKFHIVSGSDGIELNKICSGLDLDKFFITIQGSPTPKKQLVRDLLSFYSYDKTDVCLIGDSGNDQEAAEYNQISFFGYNNEKLKGDSSNYINQFY